MIGTEMECIGQGELAVGAARVNFSSDASPVVDWNSDEIKRRPVAGVWFGAPTGDHSVGDLNTGRILIGIAADDTGNTKGSIPLEVTDYVGVFIPINDITKLWLTGLNAGDVVEWSIWYKK